jgi:hypothetical protein
MIERTPQIDSCHMAQGSFRQAGTTAGRARLLGGTSHRTNFRFSLSFSGPDKLAHIEIGPVLSVPQTLGEGSLREWKTT